ncbi:MAG: hypothetical protein KIS81_02460 [Maricaulaceae bacterium]|nr:hypothetical protein [Maricaulaceae bacterium]
MTAPIRNMFCALLAAAALSAPALAAEDEGEAAYGLYAIVYSRGPGWDDSRAFLEQDLRPHGAYLAGLHRDGRLLAAGPLFGPEGGLVILRAQSLEEAEAMMAEDPAVLNGVFTGEVREWRTRFVSEDPLPATLR